MNKSEKYHEINFEETVFDDTAWSDFGYLELPTSKKTFLLVGAAVLLVNLLVIGRLVNLNFINHKAYAARAGVNVSREINLPVERALIVDRYGVPLTENVNSFSVFLNISELRGKKEELEILVNSLAEILNVDTDELAKIVNEADLSRNNWIALARNVSSSEAIAIKGLNNEALQVVNDYERRYPYKDAFAHILGYTGVGKVNEIVGKTGLELQYDDLIRGEEGRYVFYENALGKTLDKKIIAEPKPSEPLKLTIDAELQKYFYERLKFNLERLGRDSGVGIALDPKTGEILSLVSLPSFDNNVFVDKKRSAEREKLLGNRSQPFFNRAISGLYSPGSTIKPLVALSALTAGVILEESRIFSSGALTIPNPYYPDSPSVFLDWRAHGWVNLASALAQSSNIYFYLLGGGLPDRVPRYELVDGFLSEDGLGIKRLKAYWEKFKFGAKSGVDLPSEAAGFLPDADEKKERTGEPWRLGDTYNVSIGQGDLLVTPLQLINFIASMGNGGKIYKPFIKAGTEPEILADYSDLSDAIQAVQNGLADAVRMPYGSSHSLADLPIKVAGKTGTPQIKNNARVNAFFSGYGPIDDTTSPQIAVLVFVENAKEGSLNALPVAKDVFRWYYENRIK